MMDQHKLRDYFEDKAENVLEKIEQTPARKLIVTILVLVSFGVLTLGYLQIKTQLERPFLADKLVEDKAKIRGPREFLDFYKREQRNRAELIDLQQKDSDTDGLTDYQEIYIYRTNAFNQDSDVDQTNDYDEIANGSDPNCPSGQMCDEEGFIIPSGTGGSSSGSETTQQAADTSNSSSQAELDINSVLNSSDNGESQLNNFTIQERGQLKTYFENLTVQDFKQLLIQQNFPVEQLNALSENDLAAMLEVIKNTFNQ